MKSNKKTYLLLTLVLIIWGLLAFRIVKTLNPTEEKKEPIEITTSDIPEITIKRDTFSISGDYRDPFLGTLPKKTRKSKISKPKKIEVPKRNITYQGSVALNDSGDRMFFVSVDGQQHVFEKRKEIDGVMLISGDKKSIKIKYKGHRETHTIQQ
jgi:hypothetical protein